MYKNRKISFFGYYVTFLVRTSAFSNSTKIR